MKDSQTAEAQSVISDQDIGRRTTFNVIRKEETKITLKTTNSHKILQLYCLKTKDFG